MITYEAPHDRPRRAPRIWIVETLVVLGVLGFGYFALTLDASLLRNSVPVETIDPLVEFTR